MNKRKYIAYLFLITISVVLGHNMIPHQHHHGTLSPDHDCNQPLEHEHEHTPLHCHAFNDLELYKSNNGIQSLLPITELNLLLPDIFDLPGTDAFRKTSGFIQLKIPLSRSCHGKSHSLRGPPLAA